MNWSPLKEIFNKQQAWLLNLCFSVGAFLRLCEEQEVEVHQLQDGYDYGDEDCPVEFKSSVLENYDSHIPENYRKLTYPLEKKHKNWEDERIPIVFFQWTC